MADIVRAVINIEVISDYQIERSLPNNGDRVEEIFVPLEEVKTTIFKRHRVSNIKELALIGKLDSSEFLAELECSQYVRGLIMKCKPNDHQKCIATLFNGRFSPYKAVFQELK